MEPLEHSRVRHAGVHLEPPRGTMTVPGPQFENHCSKAIVIDYSRQENVEQ